MWLLLSWCQGSAGWSCWSLLDSRRPALGAYISLRRVKASEATQIPRGQVSHSWGTHRCLSSHWHTCWVYECKLGARNVTAGVDVSSFELICIKTDCNMSVIHYLSIHPSIFFTGFSFPSHMELVPISSSQCVWEREGTSWTGCKFILFSREFSKYMIAIFDFFLRQVISLTGLCINLDRLKRPENNDEKINKIPNFNN